MKTIRRWRHDDLDSLVANANSWEVWRNMRDTFPHPYREENGRDWLAVVVDCNPVTHFAIQCDRKAVGGIGVHPGSDIESISGEIGYWIGEEYWGRGLATAAVHEFTAYLFHTLNLSRVFAVPFARNKASIRVLEKLGFRCEGAMVDSACKDGQLESQTMYAVTKGEWRYDTPQ